MKKSLTILLTIMLGCLFNARAIDISPVDKASPTDEIFMDMAVSAAKKSIASGNAPAGAVIILNGAWRATGTPEGNRTPEEVAWGKARLDNLKNAVVYTVNEPVTDVVNLLNSLGVSAIYFTNPRTRVIQSGIYPATAYDDAKLDTSLKAAPMYMLAFPEASQLL